jgi:hypothetical protein
MPEGKAPEKLQEKGGDPPNPLIQYDKEFPTEP